MYVSTDPRSRLLPASPASRKPIESFGAANYVRFYELAPHEETAGARTWYARGEHFVVAYSEAAEGVSFRRDDQPDEYMLILPDRDCEVEVAWNGRTTKVPGFSVTFIPAGASLIEVAKPGRLVRFFTSKSADLVELVSRYLPGYNADHNVAPFAPWPDPKDGFRVRSYSLDVDREAGRQGRIFRCTTFMVNFGYRRTEPRDRTKMSPHSHDDFQQCSLCLDGAYVHHLRWPWLTDMNKWREDEHQECRAPSVTIIPCQVVHTSEAIDPKANQLVDVFCPPRSDFSGQEGWVLNRADYPNPKNLSA